MKESTRIKREQTALDTIEDRIESLAFNAGIPVDEIARLQEEHKPQGHRAAAIRRLRRIEALAKLVTALNEAAVGVVAVNDAPEVEVPPPDDEPEEVVIDELPADEDDIVESGTQMIDDFIVLNEAQVNALKAANIFTMSDLAAASDEDLLAVDGVGKATVEAIRRAMEVESAD